MTIKKAVPPKVIFFGGVILVILLIAVYFLGAAFSPRFIAIQVLSPQPGPVSQLQLWECYNQCATEYQNNQELCLDLINSWWPIPNPWVVFTFSSCMHTAQTAYDDCMALCDNAYGMPLPDSNKFPN